MIRGILHLMSFSAFGVIYFGIVRGSEMWTSSALVFGAAAGAMACYSLWAVRLGKVAVTVLSVLAAPLTALVVALGCAPLDLSSPQIKALWGIPFGSMAGIVLITGPNVKWGRAGAGGPDDKRKPTTTPTTTSE